MAKVLLVEDDQQIQRMYATMFNFKNFDVIVAGDGEEGLHKARESNPDVILLDVMMPRMNGMEMLKQAKKDPAISHIPIIMLSNLADEADIQKALDLGALKYIIKSEYIPKQVAEMVEQAIA